MTLKLIGYWNGEHAPGWPDPQQFIDESWDEHDRTMIGWYLDSGFITRTFMGYSPCRICGKSNGDLELTDGVYVWPNGFLHYVADHSVKPPDEFIEHVKRKLDEFEAAPYDTSWWEQFARPDDAEM